MMHFGEKIKNLREDSGYKQKEMAKKLNVTASAYGYYEQDRNEPALETTKRIAQIFQVSMDYLFGMIDKPQHQKYYPISASLTLTETELIVVQKLKDVQLLEDLSSDPHTHVDRLKRYWEFIKQEHS